jgi:hypothetical protein
MASSSSLRDAARRCCCPLCTNAAPADSGGLSTATLEPVATAEPPGLLYTAIIALSALCGSGRSRGWLSALDSNSLRAALPRRPSRHALPQHTHGAAQAATKLTSVDSNSSAPVASPPLRNESTRRRDTT